MEEEHDEDAPSPRKTSSKAREETHESKVPSESITISDFQSSLSSIGHDVTFTVTIAVAVPTEPDEQSQLKEAISKQMIDAPRVQNYYHVEYNLLPEDERMKADIVTYGLACKIYMEKHEARVIKTWQEGGFTWFAWAHSQTVTVTKEVLLKMFNHTVEFRLWNTKDKCSSRARFDRPKAFRLPQPKPGEKPEDIGGVKAVVTELLKCYTDMQPKKAVLIRPLLSQVDERKHASESKLNTTDQINPAKNSKNGKASNHSSQLAEAGRLEAVSSPTGRKNMPAKSKTEKHKTGGKEDKEMKKQLSDEARILAEQVKKFGICMIPLRLSLLFGDRKTVISRLESPVPGIEDMFLQVSIDCPLLSLTEEEDLNPMIIQICSVTSLPSSPISYADLKLKCHPVYCKYKFFKEPDHVTPGREHSKNIYWDDTNVILLGTMESSQLKEYLNGPGMEIEVHDRDRKPEQVTLKPTLFGDDLEDEKISNVGTVESRRTLHNPFHGRDKPWDPYGVAKVDFSELLLGCRFLEFTIPILNCPIPDILGIIPNATGKLVGVAGAVDGPVDKPFRAGHYVQESSMLKVRIQLARPLTIPTMLMTKDYIADSKESPFNRIIYIFDYHNVELLHNLQTLVMSFNARALGLDTMSQHVIDAALSTYKLSIVQQCSLDLNIVTGFHVLDGERHIFVLEGLRDKAIDVLWETLPQPEQSDVRVLYNSDLCFSKRLYGPLDVDLCRIKLHEPLSVIVQQPLLYIRDMVFRPCYDALIKLDQITKMDKMRTIVKNDLFPTAEMVVSMSREFGVPFTQTDFEELQPSISEDTVEQGVTQDEPSQPETSCKFPLIDSFNQVYEEHLKKDTELKNYIKANIKDVHIKSEATHLEREKNKKAYFSVDISPAYNYSIQYLNSTELVKDQLRQYLREQDPTSKCGKNLSRWHRTGRLGMCSSTACAPWGGMLYKATNLVVHEAGNLIMSNKLPKKPLLQDHVTTSFLQGYHLQWLHALYAYNQEFMSGMFCPVNIEQERKDLEAAERARWRTEKGWTNSGRKSVRESYIHPHHPDCARLDELREEWVENSLHANIIKSPLDRGHFPWCDRKKDLDLYARPPPDFGNKVPLSICTAGMYKCEELKAAKLKNIEDWMSRVVTDDIRQYFHRVLPATEMKLRGFYSSNQLDRLKGLLKDPVRKRGLVVRESNVNDIPALAVVNYPCLDVSATHNDTPSCHANCEDAHDKFCGLKPGDLPHSWTKNDNQIPCYNYEHEKFKQLKGHDFSAYYKSGSKLSIRPILPLRPEERDNNLFRTPLSARFYSDPLPPVTQRSQIAQILLDQTNNNQVPDEIQGLTDETTECLEETALPGPPEVSEMVNETSSQFSPEAKMETLQQHILIMA